VAERDHIIEQIGAGHAERPRAVAEERQQHACAPEVAGRGAPRAAVLRGLVAALVIDDSSSGSEVAARAAAAIATAGLVVTGVEGKRLSRFGAIPLYALW
jgi:hypothetical protein